MGLFRDRTQPEGDYDPTATFEARLASVGPGVPGHCPSCDGLGYIDNLDIGHRFQIQHCKDCGHRWEYLFDTDGRVVGLTELDEHGHPVARMRIRTRSAEPAAAAAAPATSTSDDDVQVEAGEVVDLTGDTAPTDVIDLREPVIELTTPELTTPELTTPAPATPAPADADHMSPAEWLRHARRR